MFSPGLDRRTVSPEQHHHDHHHHPSDHLHPEAADQGARAGLGPEPHRPGDEQQRPGASLLRRPETGQRQE